ncbi:DNA helicase [Tanacetum coccineum]
MVKQAVTMLCKCRKDRSLKSCFVADSNRPLYLFSMPNYFKTRAPGKIPKVESNKPNTTDCIKRGVGVRAVGFISLKEEIGSMILQARVRTNWAQGKIHEVDSRKPNTGKSLHLKGREENARGRTQLDQRAEGLNDDNASLRAEVGRLRSDYETSHSSVDIQQPATFEPHREATPFVVHRSSPFEGVLLQVPGSSSCGLKRNSSNLNVFKRYSQLCARDTTVCSHPPSSNTVITSNITNAQSICNDSPRTASAANEDFRREWANISSSTNSLGKEIILDFEQLDVRLASSERHLEKALLKPRHFWDERYGCLFQQLGSVETEGQSSGAGQETYVTAPDVNANESINSQGSNHVSLPAPMPSKRARYSVLDRPLSSEASPLKRRRSSTTRVRNTRMPDSMNVNGQHYGYALLDLLFFYCVLCSVCDCNQRCRHRGAAFWFGERLKGHFSSRRPEYHKCCGGGSLLCPLSGDPPRFLQLYIYDTEHELENRMRHFGGLDNTNLDPQIIKLYNADGARGYELPASNTLGAIVFDSGLTGSTEFDVIIEHRGGLPKRINKLHKRADGSERERRVTMLAYYAYQLHPRVNDYNLIFRGEGCFSNIWSGFFVVWSKIGLISYEINKMIYKVTIFQDYTTPFQEEIEIGLKLENERIFGTVIGVLYTVEFQKRGLPHCHTLLWVDSASKIQGPEDVDRLISAELPDPQVDHQGYKVFSAMMIHGPCDPVNMSATCMEGDKCSKGFPKKFTEKTFFDDQGHVHYRRRDTCVSALKHQIRLDNSNVVPYNRDLLLAYDAHINVEPLGQPSNATYSSRQPVDEIQNYVEDRFVCPHEAIWRILKFDIHSREPAVQMLSVHLKDMQRITFRDRDRIESVINLPGRKRTTLTEWFAYNAANEDGRDFPEVQSVHEIFYSTCRAACEALGLLTDDNEWDIAMQEACVSATSSQLRSVFAHILSHCEDGMDRVLEEGPWLIRLVPLFLNIWTPNTRLEKGTITSAPVWVKLYNVPIVAFSEIGLSLITSQLGKPIMLDAYTSSMCQKSWGRNEYARALIEVSALTPLLDSVVVAVPFLNGSGHSFETVEVEYEWQPPRINLDVTESQSSQTHNDSLNEYDDEECQSGHLCVNCSFLDTVVKLRRYVLEVAKTALVLILITSLLREEDGLSYFCLRKNLFCNMLYEDIANHMVREVTDQEIRKAMFSIGDNKAPGPNGYSAAFFKEAWNIVGTDVDIQKAYDTVDWNFLRAVLVGFGFHHRMIGKRGLRQGDPLSPYLFTLVMEVLTLMLHRRARVTNSFTYHRYCSKLNIINLCFADDLFLFAHGLYFAIVLNSKCHRLAILAVLPFEEEKLPVKYLGVPLVPSRFVYRDCAELVERVKRRISDWKNKFLSFAGRAQLVRSVLSSMHIYWASMFILPSSLILELEQLMRGFLWCQGEMKKGKAKVAWEVVCLPKKEGGLGIRRLDIFNKALISSHIWSILSGKESLWVKWIHTYKLKGRSFWDTPSRGNMSWGWRKILQVRHLVRPIFRSHIGNGNRTFAWHDHWSSLGPLSSVVSNRDIYSAGFHLNAKVSELTMLNAWKWPDSWYVKYPLLSTVPAPNFSDALDRVYLTNWSNVDVEFSVAEVWEALRPRNSEGKRDVNASLEVAGVACEIAHALYVMDCLWVLEMWQWAAFIVLCRLKWFFPIGTIVTVFLF